MISLLTVGLLEPGASTATTELLGLTAPGIGDEEGAVVSDEDILDLLLGLLVDVLLVEGDEGLGDALANGVDLGGVPAALVAVTNVNASEALAAEEEDWLVRLVGEDLRLHQLDGAAVDLDQTATALTVGDGHRRLLAAEALDGLNRSGRR